MFGWEGIRQKFKKSKSKKSKHILFDFSTLFTHIYLSIYLIYLPLSLYIYITFFHSTLLVTLQSRRHATRIKSSLWAIHGCENEFWEIFRFIRIGRLLHSPGCLAIVIRAHRGSFGTLQIRIIGVRQNFQHFLEPFRFHRHSIAGLACCKRHVLFC